MKCIFVLILTAAAMCAADFATGQAARLVIGQITFTQQDEGASDTLLGAAGGVAFANNMLFVVDGNRFGAGPINNRVLVYRNVSSWLPSPTDALEYNTKCPVCVGRADVVLGQPDFTHSDIALNETGMRTPTAVASDGVHLVVADTDNNRVLIWNSIPTSNNTPADVVVGQPDFKTGSIPPGNIPTAKSMRGPQGVWIQDGKLYVADTQNHRVLIYNSIPTSNGASADVVLGQPNFTTFVEPDLTQANSDALPNNLLNPVSVTSDGQHLFVTDLGHHRVLIWNSIPTTNQAPADVEIGQPDMTSSIANNSYSVASDGTLSKVLCDSTGTDADTGALLFPEQCNATLSFPRYSLSDGKRLFIADGGNDRVLVFSSIPTQNAASADYVIGQLGGEINQASDAVDSLRTPASLAWDGTNLYVADTYNRRIEVFSPGEHNVPYTGVRNGASFEIHAVGAVALDGDITADDTVTITINDKEYTYKVLASDDLGSVTRGLVNLINAGSGDPNVFATANEVVYTVILTARVAGSDGNAITLAASTSSSSTITPTTSGSTLDRGGDAAQIAPGTIVSVLGSNLSDSIETAPDGDQLPETLANTQVYFNGIRSPLFYVSPSQINAQIPFEFTDVTSVNAIVRTAHADGSVTVTTPAAVTIVPQNPGVFTYSDSPDPRPAVVMHSSSYATGTVSVDGSINAGDVASITIGEGDSARTYSYTVTASDTLDTVRDALIGLINNTPDPQVEATAAGQFDRIRLKARVAGPDGNGLVYTAAATGASGDAQVVMTPTTPALCCANVAGAPVTQDNPALPGETITVLATGLGIPTPTDGVNTGQKFQGPDNTPVQVVDDAQVGGKTANVLTAQLKKGMVGVWEVDLELNSDIPTNPVTQFYIAQAGYVSNIVTIPVYNPNPSTDTTDTTTP
jgi:uncharacterized protein (TIGR03437 family)